MEWLQSIIGLSFHFIIAQTGDAVNRFQTDKLFWTLWYHVFVLVCLPLLEYKLHGTGTSLCS